MEAVRWRVRRYGDPDRYGDEGTWDLMMETIYEELAVSFYKAVIKKMRVGGVRLFKVVAGKEKKILGTWAPDYIPTRIRRPKD